MSSGYFSDQWTFFAEKFINENNILFTILEKKEYLVYLKMISPVKYNKETSADSKQGIEAYLGKKENVEKCDASNGTHPLMRFSYILFHSSDAYKMLQIYGGFRNAKATSRVFFEEVGLLDKLKNRNTIGALNFKAKSDSEQTKHIRDILYTNEYRIKGPNEDLKGAWVIKSINLQDPDDISVKIYDLNNIKIQVDKKITPEKTKEAIISDISNKIEQFKKDYESAVDTGNLVVAYQIGGSSEYITAPDLQERISNGFQTSVRRLSNAIENDRKSAIEELRRIRKKKEKDKQIMGEIKECIANIDGSVKQKPSQLTPPEEIVEELEPVA